MITNGQANRLSAAVAKVMAPRATIRLPHGSEINCIPRLPISMPVQPIKEDTAPDGRPCWTLEVQGDHADKVTAALVERGYPAKRAGG